MIIRYGTIEENIDVTDICLLKLTKNNIITIPNGDENRANFFTDPVCGIKKKIFITLDDITNEYEDYYLIKIDIVTKLVNTISDYELDEKIANIHSKLNIQHGNFSEELPEQKMVVRYLTGNENVLEIGGNIGRNSLIISSILKNDNNLVTLESDKDIAVLLKENRDLNNLNFHIENSALSMKKLIQREWDTIYSDELLDGYKWVNTITLNELYDKYNITFDTLILDCEGAFYYILIDMPEILNNISLIIMENDYHDILHKQYVDNVLTQHNFYRDYVESGGWGVCYNNFYEVWKK
jgi:FkbM family methyltransferase